MPANPVANSTAAPKTARRTYGPAVTLERTFKAAPEKLWAMWTTKEGLEKWYWPEGLVAKVLKLDLRVGGGYEIAAEGLPHTSRGDYTEIVPGKKLAIVAHIDFIQDVEPYDRIDIVEFHTVPGGTKLVFTATQHHDPKWNGMAKEGWSSSLDKLDRALAADASGKSPAQTQPNPSGFTIERTFKAAPEKVWEMWTTKKGLEAWFCPDGYTTKVTKLDLRVTGEYAYQMKSKEHIAVNHGVYVQVQPHHRLAMIWQFDIFLKPGEKPYNVPITVEFHPHGTGTRMVFTQGPLASPEFTEGSRQGVMSNFEKLAKNLGE